MQRKYSTKFKQHAIQKVTERKAHQTIMDIALGLNVNLFTLKSWLKLSRRDPVRQNTLEDTFSASILHEEVQFLKAELLRKDRLIVAATALLVQAQKLCLVA